jgi:Flp pilus assembly protein TadD
MANSSKRSQTQTQSPTPTLDRLAAQTQIDFELEFFNDVLKRNPGFVEVLKAHAKNLASKKRHEEGLTVDRQIANLRPEDSLAQYNLACSLALTARNDDALDALRKAIELGYRDFRFMREDSDLDSIRKDPRFRAILREYEKKR